MNLEIAGYETVGYLDGNEAYEAITLEQMITITENCDPGQAVITFSLD